MARPTTNMKNPFEKPYEEPSPDESLKIIQIKAKEVVVKPYPEKQAPLEDEKLTAYLEHLKKDEFTKNKPFEFAENADNPNEWALRTPLPDGTHTLTFIPKSTPFQEIKDIVWMRLMSSRPEEDYIGAERLLGEDREA